MGRLWLRFEQVVILGAEDSRDLGPRLAVIHGLRDPDDLDQPVYSSGATGSAYVLRTLRTSESRSAINAQCVDAVVPRA